MTALTIETVEPLFRGIAREQRGQESPGLEILARGITGREPYVQAFAAMGMAPQETWAEDEPRTWTREWLQFPMDGGRMVGRAYDLGRTVAVCLTCHRDDGGTGAQAYWLFPTGQAMPDPPDSAT